MANPLTVSAHSRNVQANAQSPDMWLCSKLMLLSARQCSSADTHRHAKVPQTLRTKTAPSKSVGIQCSHCETV
jgi:hypothetical protein